MGDKKARLTIIIPFRNEGEEVRNTVESLLDTAGEKVEVILINDKSSDGYNYKAIADSFNAIYIEHQCNKGVAYSRDEAVEICSTDFFIMFDAHMRAFTPKWATLLINELEKEDRTLFCCTTVALDGKAKLLEDLNTGGYGVIMNIPELSYEWNSVWHDDFDNNNTMTINCVMGASYACNVKYWKYLKGLEGLRSYGLDEQFISIKVSLEGGKCKVIRNIIFGHIFRTAETVPYDIKTADFIFNNMYLMELLYTEEMKISQFHNLKTSYASDLFQEAIKLLSEQRTKIKEMRIYYSSIFTRCIKDIY